MESPYSTPVIPYNLSKTRTIVQVAEVLEHLSMVTDSLMKRISNRIESSNDKLNDISQRIDKVNRNIGNLTGAKKATQVFSSSKYPAADINKSYTSLFSDPEPVKLVRTKVKHDNSICNDERLEKLHVYHVKLRSSEEKPNFVGLGDMPNDIECINDVLLYNSGKNLYKNFVMSDTLDIARQSTKPEKIDKSYLEPAPYSISERANMTKSKVQPYVYSPNLGEVPTLDVPLDLPDLPGIADDLRYENEEGPGIAPSATTTPHIPDLPLIETLNTGPVKEEHILPENLPPPPKMVSVEPKSVSVPVAKVEKVVDLPKEVPVEQPVRTKPNKSENVEPTATVETEVLPPSSTPKPSHEKKHVEKSNPPPDMHASLMDAIRKAGGAEKAKLRTVQKEDSVPEKVSGGGGGGDLMADLHAKLSMRRKGISGTKKQDSSPAGASSAMERISAMIPPPVPKSDMNDSTNTEDDEWDE